MFAWRPSQKYFIDFPQQVENYKIQNSTGINDLEGFLQGPTLHFSYWGFFFLFKRKSFEGI